MTAQHEHLRTSSAKVPRSCRSSSQKTREKSLISKDYRSVSEKAERAQKLAIERSCSAVLDSHGLDMNVKTLENTFKSPSYIESTYGSGCFSENNLTDIVLLQSMGRSILAVSANASVDLRQVGKPNILQSACSRSGVKIHLHCGLCRAGGEPGTKRREGFVWISGGGQVARILIPAPSKPVHVYLYCRSTSDRHFTI